MEQITLSQDICNCEKQTPENGKDCSARSARHANGCTHHHHISEDTTGSRLLITLALNFIIPVVQVVGGIAAHSMALISDATHNFSDFTTILISYIALKIGKKGASLQNTFGYRRAEILAALLNVAILLGASAIIVYGAFQRLQNPEIVSGGLVMEIAAIGVIGNGFSAWLLYRDAKDSLNVRGAFLHMMGDMLTSVVVLINGLILIFKPWYWLDPLLSLLIVIFIVKNGWSILKESIAILMNATPGHLDIQAVQTFLQNFQDIFGAHYLHAWSLGSSGVAFSCHVVVKDQPISQTRQLREKISHALFHEFGIDHPVLQFETSSCGNGNLFCEDTCAAVNPSEPHEHGDNRTSWTDRTWPRHFALAARLILGGVFIYASFDKILHPAAFAEVVFNYQILPSQLINLMALILPLLELILGVLLLSGIWVSGAVLGVNLLMVVFLSALIFNTARGLNISCGCFSTETTSSGLSVWTVFRDVFFFCLSAYLLFVTTQANRLKK
ncbi:MAG: cation diffusion facilitator family transporter [Deltaproteobacteria bacterium]|nr:cation diffusion facilitator family transporter [Deltaproteobacteria bacterium]